MAFGTLRRPNPNSAPLTTPDPRNQADPQAMNPFTRASYMLEELFLDKTIPAITTAQQAVDLTEIPARGYLRGLWLWVTCSGGAGGNPALAADGPWSILKEVRVEDVNSTYIFQATGWQLYLINLLGGYHWHPNPLDSPNHVATVSNPGFMLWVPLEVRSRDARGALPNMNAAAAYRLRVTLAPAGEIWGTSPTTKLPAVRVRAFDSHWAPAAATDIMGKPNATSPPGLGTTQFWSVERHTVAAGNMTVQLQRTGNYLRNLIVIGRTAGGARSNSVLPSPSELRYDGHTLMNIHGALMNERRSRNIPRAIKVDDAPAGVYLYSFCDDLDGHQGEEVGNAYLPTTAATRLELRGGNSAPGTIDLLINDLAPGVGGSLY